MLRMTCFRNLTWFSSSIASTITEACSTIPKERIRNFSIIGHVDSGKSSLTDKILNVAGNLSEEDTSIGQVLDKLKVERERGITVKAQNVTMVWKNHLFNLLDTRTLIRFLSQCLLTPKTKKSGSCGFLL